MNHRKVIQSVIDRIGAQDYLEIGVNKGACFLPIQARCKIAVDPDFQIPRLRRARWALRNLGSRYFRMTSDDFFAQAGSSLRCDVVFIDGLHTYEQSRQDAENALQVLNEGGVILMHDCNPPNAAAAQPSGSPAQAGALGLPGWTDEWCGDVWKTICALRRRKDLRVFVIDGDCGLGVVTRGPSAGGPELTDAELQKLGYADLERDRARWLDLKPESVLPGFLAGLGRVGRAAAKA